MSNLEQLSSQLLGDSFPSQGHCAAPRKKNVYNKKNTYNQFPNSRGKGKYILPCSFAEKLKIQGATIILLDM